VNEERKNIVLNIAIEGVLRGAQPDELLIDLINRAGGRFLRSATTQLGPVQFTFLDVGLLLPCVVMIALGLFSECATPSPEKGLHVRSLGARSAV
jgi:hypothetical protein